MRLSLDGRVYPASSNLPRAGITFGSASLMCRHHIWFCLADRLPVPTGRLARRNYYTSVPYPYPQLFYWAYALVEASVSSKGKGH